MDHLHDSSLNFTINDSLNESLESLESPRGKPLRDPGDHKNGTTNVHEEYTNETINGAFEQSLDHFISDISNSKVYAFADPNRGASTANPLLYKIFGSYEHSYAHTDESFEDNVIVVDNSFSDDSPDVTTQFSIQKSLN